MHFQYHFTDDVFGRRVQTLICRHHPTCCRYFLLVKSDFTLRRYQNDSDVTADKPSKLPRSYRLSDIEFIAKDTSPRFYIQLRSQSVGGKGEQVKFAAETDSERAEWISAIMKLKEQVPPEEDDDPYRKLQWATRRCRHGSRVCAFLCSPSLYQARGSPETS